MPDLGISTVADEKVRINVNRGARKGAFRWRIIGYGKVAVAHTYGIQCVGHRLTGYSTGNPIIQSGDARGLEFNIGPTRGQLFDVQEMFISSNWRDLLGDLDNVDGYIICAPTKYHTEIALAVAQTGKHCLIEKPIALDAQEGVQILEAFGRSQGKVAVAQVLPAFPGYAYLHELLQKIDLQDLYRIEMHRHLGWDALLEQSEIAKDTGFAQDLGIHDINLLLHRFPDLALEAINSHWVNDRAQQVQFKVSTQALVGDQEIIVDVGVSGHSAGFAHSWRLQMRDGTGYCFNGKEVWSDCIPGEPPCRVDITPLSVGQIFGCELEIAKDYFRGKKSDCDFLNATRATATLSALEWQN